MGERTWTSGPTTGPGAKALCLLLAAVFAAESLIPAEVRAGRVWAAQDRNTDLARLETSPLPSAREARLPASHLPAGFEDIPSFHPRLVTDPEGYFQIIYQDIAIPGPGPALEIRRVYNSHIGRESSFGLGWSWNYGIRLKRDEDTGEPVIRDADNLRVHFRKMGGEYLSINTALPERLTWGSGGAVRTFSDGRKHHFTSGGRLAAIEDAQGRRLVLKYGGQGLSEVTDAAGRSLKFTYDGDHIVAVADPLGRQWKYSYDGRRLEAVEDPLGRRTRHVYLPRFGWRERMSHVRFPNGADMTIYYHPLTKRVTRIQGPGPMSTSFRTLVNPYERTMRTWVTNPRGDQSRTRFEAERLEAEEAGEDSPGSDILYLDKRKLGEWRYMESKTVRRDPEGGKSRVTATESEIVLEDEEERETRLAKDAEGRVAQITDPLGNQTRLSWDGASGKVSRVELPGGGSLSFRYERGELRAVTDPMGRTTRLEVAPAADGGRITKVIDPAGREQSIDADRYGYARRVRDTAGQEWRLTHDVVGRLLKIVDPVGNVREFTYDAADNLVAEETAIGVSRFQYDELDNLTRSVDPLGRVTRFSYDARGLLTEATLPGGLTIRYDHDRTGNVVSVTRSGGNRQAVRRFAYDKNDLLLRAEDSLGRAVEYGYDGTGQPTSLRLPRGGAFTFDPDPLGRVLEEKHPDGSLVLREYGPGTQPVSVRHVSPDGKASALAYEYDPAGRLIKVIGSKGPVREREYDPTGRLLQARAGRESIAQEFDPAGRLAAVRSGPHELRYEYDAASRRAACLQPGGLRVAYTYHESGKVGVIEVPDLGKFELEADEAARMVRRGAPDVRGPEVLPAVQRAALRFPKGLRADLDYDASRRLTRVVYRGPDGAEAASFAYEYDPLGEIRSVTEDGRKVTYSYDPAGRLLSASDGGREEKYAYDADDNLTEIGARKGFQYDGAGKLLRSGGVEWRYNERGDLAEKSDGSRYRYDEEGRLTGVALPDGTRASYRYDPFGRRVEKEVNGTVTRYVYDGLHLAAEFDGQGHLTARYLHAPSLDHPLAMWRGGKWYFFATDRLGSVRALLDEAGKVVERYRYTAYGLPLADGAARPSVSALHPFGFAGREFDPDTGLYWMRARYYDPAAARFIQRDPMGPEAETNLYAYALGNPVELRDPLGMTSTSDIVWEYYEWAGDKAWKWEQRWEDPVTTSIAEGAEYYAKRQLTKAYTQWAKEVRATRNFQSWFTPRQMWLGTYGSKSYKAVNAARAIRKLPIVKLAGLIGFADTVFAMGRALGIAGYSLWTGRPFDLVDTLWPVINNTLWLLAPYLLTMAHPVLLVIGALLLAVLILDILGVINLEEWFSSLLEWLGVTNADPTFVQNPSPSPPLGALRDPPLLLGRKGLPPGPGGPVRLYDPGGAFLGDLDPAREPAAEVLGKMSSAAHALLPGDPPVYRRVATDLEAPAVKLEALPDGPPGRLALRVGAADPGLAEIVLRASVEDAPRGSMELLRLRPPLPEGPVLVDLHRFREGGPHVLEAVARDRAGNESSARARVEIPARSNRAAAVYGLRTRVTADVIEEPPAGEEETREPAEAPAPPPPAGTAPDVKPAWVSGAAPAGAKVVGDWIWGDKVAYGAARSHTGATVPGTSIHYFIRANPPLVLEPQDNLVQYVYLDPEAPPRQILVGLYLEGEKGEHRVFWGDDLIDLGAPAGTSGLFRAGPLPPAGAWVRLRVPVGRFGLNDAKVTGCLWAQHGGRAWWGPTTKSASHLDPSEDARVVSTSARGSKVFPYEVDVEAGFELSAAADVQVRVETPEGRRVASLTSGLLPAGSHRLAWDARGENGQLVPDGAYRLVVEGRGFRAEAPFAIDTLVARLIMPAEGSLVQAHVPLYGTAAGREFDRYVLEFGPGADPKEWKQLGEWREPQVLFEPPLAFDHRHTLHGNLGSFEVEGSIAYAFKWSQAHTGLHTFRLRVFARDGRSAEDRVRLWFAPVAANGGQMDVPSADGRAFFRIGGFSLRDAFRLFHFGAAEPRMRADLEAAAAARGARLHGPAYELRPAGFRFERPAEVEILLDPGDSPADPLRAAVHAFDPAAGAWLPLKAARAPKRDDQGRFSYLASAEEMPAGRSLFGVVADAATASPVALEVRPESRRVDIPVVAEPGAEVSVFKDPAGAPVRQARVGASGLAVLGDVYLEEGPNAFLLKARDGSGNESASVPFSVRLERGGDPVVLEALSIEQSGEELILKGQAAPGPAGAVRRTPVRLTSQADPSGFRVDLLEEPGTGRFSGRVRAGRAGDPGRAVLRIARHEETVAAEAEGGPRATLAYRDLVPPGPPEVLSGSHPAVRLGAASGVPAEWTDGRRSRSLLDQTIDLRRFPVLSFRYRIEPGATAHLSAKIADTWYGLTFSGHKQSGWSMAGKESYVPLRDFELNDDGQWHWAHLSLYPALPRRRAPKDAMLHALQLGAWENTGYREVSAREPADRRGFEIAEAYARAAGTVGQPSLEWSDPEDVSGIVDYSFVLDTSPETVPTGTGRGKVNRVALEAPPVQGPVFFHIRAKDGAGNWGPPTHFPLTADGVAPVAGDPEPAPGSRTGTLAIRLGLTDGPGSGVDPDSIRLRVAGQTYTTKNPALSYDSSAEKLSFLPAISDPPLPAWPDGTIVDVELEAAADMAGNALREKLRWEFAVDYQSPGAGKCRMLTREGGVEPAWSPDGRSIAYVVDAGKRSLWTIDVENGQTRRLAEDLEGVSAPAWSPDGRTLAVSAGSGDRRAIHAVDVAGAPSRKLTSGSWDDRDPAWLPDGGIAFVRDGDLWRMKADGSAAGVLFDDREGARVSRPQPAEGGKSLLFCRTLYNDQVWLLRLDSLEARPFLSAGIEVDPAPGPAPGEVIHASRERGSVLRSAKEGGAASRAVVENSGWWDQYPRVSPDGRRLAFQSTRNGFWNVWLLEWLSLGELRVEPDRVTYPPSGAPPGVRISFDVRGFAVASLRLLDAGGTEVRGWKIEGKGLTEPSTLEWDASGPEGKPLPGGRYRLEIAAVPPGGGDALARGAALVVGDAAGARGGGSAPVWPWAAGALVLAAGVVLFFILRRRRTERAGA